ncbi:MAG: hypothetical protein EXR70_00030 [Deltaproteobacteria bacterium]|nr:hypothetical protein [Deltaproteobacteria bacterium]
MQSSHAIQLLGAATLALLLTRAHFADGQSLKVPYGDRRAVKFALDQMSTELPQSAKLNPDDFIDNTILTELDKSGFIDQIYR